MANFFVSYDLNGKTPTHAEMDAHLKKIGKCVHRVLETVWYVHSNHTQKSLYDYVNGILSNNDGVIIIEANDCYFRNLLVTKEAIQNCWNS